MKFGYARVSSKDQNLARQLEMLIPICDEVISEKESGKDLAARTELKKLLSKLRSKDTLIVKSIDRLARNTKELLQITDDLITREITVQFVDNGIVFDNTPYSRLILTMMGAVAEFERGIISSRQAEGIEIAKKIPGKYQGRQKNKQLHEKVTKMLLENKYTVEQIAKLCDCGRATVFRIKKQM